MQYFDEAADDFRAVLKLEPDNRAAKHQLSNAVKKQADGAARERSIFVGMFHKFAQQDLVLVFVFLISVSCRHFSVTHLTLFYRVCVILCLFLFGAVHILYNAWEGGGGVDNLVYALYGGGWLY